MKKYNYINEIKAYDRTFYDNLIECIDTIWPKTSNGDEPKINICDDFDYVECHPGIDRKDDIECYLCLDKENIKITDIAKFAKMIEVDLEKFEVYSNQDEGISLYWEETIIYP